MSSDYEGIDPTQGANAGLYMGLKTTCQIRKDVRPFADPEKRVRSRPKPLLRREITTFRLP
jgi:hypothetical protein